VAKPPEKSPEPQDAAETSPHIIAAISGFAILPSYKTSQGQSFFFDQTGRFAAGQGRAEP
jgi:hypothetical protein